MGTPKSSISSTSIGFSLINHPVLGYLHGYGTPNMSTISLWLCHVLANSANYGAPPGPEMDDLGVAPIDGNPHKRLS